MTSERDFDRIARAWLELGPDAAPERTVTAVLRAIETAPQVRKPIRWPLGRGFHMQRLPLIAVMAALIGAVVGGALVFSGGGRNSVPPVSSPTIPSTGAISVPKYCSEARTVSSSTEPVSTRMYQPSTSVSISNAQEVSRSDGH